MEPSTQPSNTNDPVVAQQAKNLTKAIFQHESGTNYNATGDAGTSKGAGQWQAATWKAQAKDVLGDENAPMTPANQSVVAQGTIRKLIGQGKNAADIAAIWNSGSDQGWQNKVGVTTINGQQIKYNVPQYVKSVTDLYQKNKAQTASVPETTNNTNQAAPTDGKGLIRKGVDFFAPVLGDISDAVQGKGNGKTGLQVLGDIGTTALSVGTLIPGLGELGPAELTAARMGVLGAKGLEGAEVASKVAPTLLKTVGKNAALGTGFGVSGALGEGETDPTKIAKSGLIGGATGGVLGGVGEVAANKLGKVAADTGASRISQQTSRLKTVGNAFKANSTKTTNPIKTLEQVAGEDGKPLSTLLKVDGNKVNADALANETRTGAIDNLIQAHADDASGLVKTLTGTVPFKDFKTAILNEIATDPTIRGTLSLPKATAAAERMLKSAQMSYGKDIPFEAIDEIRKGMNKVYDPEERDVARIIGDAARTYLYNGSGTNTAIKTAMANETELIKARNFVEKLHGTTVPGGQLGKYFAELIGAMAGGAVGTLGGPFGTGAGVLAGKYGADKATEFAQRNYFNPLIPRIAGKLQGLLQSPAGQAAQGAAKVGILRSTGN